MKSSNDLIKVTTDTCSTPDAELVFDDTLKILGDFWTLRVLESLMGGPLRFCEIERSLKHVNPVTLTKRLKVLEDNYYIVRLTETIDKQSVTYELTGKGRDTQPVVDAIKQFGFTHHG
jgi:DNA-binding HxlR family transcriptional regulator